MQLVRALPVLALASVASAQVVVPIDYPDLQAAIDAVSAGTTIVVATTEQQAPVVIDKPITIVGDPIAYVGLPPDQGCGVGSSAIRLSGSGGGRVVLAQLILTRGGDCVLMEPLVDGGGFEELHLLGVEAIVPPTGLTGLGFASAAIATTVPDVFVSDSVVIGGFDDVDIYTVGSLSPLEAHPAIDAPESTVVLLDSHAQGGRVWQIGCSFCECPDETFIYGTGAPAIVADRVMAAGSQISGGEGASIEATPVFQGPPEFCFTQPDGPAVIADHLVLLSGVVTDSGPVRSGSTWSLIYATPGPFAVLLFDLRLVPPTELAPFGWLFLDPATAVASAAIPAGSPAELEFDVPSSSALVGLTLGFQILDSSDGLSRPIAKVVVP